jgi:hypothetical protein
MRLLDQATLGVALGVGALALSTATVSAEIACRGNVCWHVQSRYEYPAEARVVVHPDDWRWRRHEHYVWREHEGRGYWRDGRWIER